MRKLKVSDEVELNYIDVGKGRPVILIHGWPLSHKAWEPQIPALVEAGYRVIAYDRRGFGASRAGWNGYDYDTFADDLHSLIITLGLKEVTLVGFSMGGGEVVRYLSRHGSDHIKSVALVASIIPLVKQKEDNPDGVPQSELDKILAAIENDRPQFLRGFVETFYNYSKSDKTVSDQQIEYDWSVAVHASPRATLEAARAWMDTDFREEAKKITVPTLIIHGDGDQLVPIQTAGDQAAKLIKGATYKVYKDGPHGLNLTAKDQFNADLLAFLK